MDKRGSDRCGGVFASRERMIAGRAEGQVETDSKTLSRTCGNKNRHFHKKMFRQPFAKR